MMYGKLFSRTCVLILLSLSPSTPMSPKKCILRKDGNIKLLICNTQERTSTMETCCYNATMDYHYCCPGIELRNMSYTSRIVGSMMAAVILVICITLLCIFSSRCPLRKTFLNYRLRRAERIADAEETAGD